MKRSELEEIIREEIEKYLQENSVSLEEKYDSDGTVPRVHNRTMTPAQIKKRESIGKKILKAISNGDDKKNPLRRAFIRWAAKNDKPITSEKTMNSYAWAMASDYAIKGKTFATKRSRKKQ
jgi:hypothetical protein